MIEVFLIALLVWLWVIERRLNSMNDTVRHLKLDVDGMRAMRSGVKAGREAPEPTPDLPEVTSLERSSKPETKKAAVH
jgi:hypothetical protein